MSRSSKGFSLIELMIVVVIVGILGAVAYPNYINYVKKTHRGEIAELMTEAAQTLERHYSRAGSYANVTTPTVVTTADPVGNAYYTLAVNRVAASGATPSSFTLTATPIAGKMMAGDMCGTYTLDNTGLRGNTGTTTGSSTAVCWGR